MSCIAYDKAWGGFEKNYNEYQLTTDPHTLYKLRPKIIQYANDTKQYNTLMKNIRGLAVSVWLLNMFHAYLIAPNDDYFDGEYFFEFEYEPNVNQFQININF